MSETEINPAKASLAVFAVVAMLVAKLIVSIFTGKR